MFKISLGVQFVTSRFVNFYLRPFNKNSKKTLHNRDLIHISIKFRTRSTLYRNVKFFFYGNRRKMRLNPKISYFSWMCFLFCIPSKTCLPMQNNLILWLKWDLIGIGRGYVALRNHKMSNTNMIKCSLFLAA